MSYWWWITGLGICNCERWFPQTCSCVSSQDRLSLQLETGGYVAVWSKLILLLKRARELSLFACSTWSWALYVWPGRNSCRGAECALSRYQGVDLWMDDPWTSPTGANLSRILVLWLLFDIYVQGAWTWLWRQACWLVDQVHGGATQVRCSNMMR